MKRTIKKLLIASVVVLALVGLTGLVLSSDTALAQTAKDEVCKGIGLAGGSSDCKPGTDQPTVDSTVKNVINIISVVVGIISVIMIIVGGLKYITSAGDSSKVSSAKDTILYAVVGLVVVAMAQVIVQFVVREAS